MDIDGVSPAVPETKRMLRWFLYIRSVAGVNNL